jgi:phage gpG-like protein
MPPRISEPMLKVDMLPPAPIIIRGFYAGANVFHNNEEALKTTIQTVVSPAIGNNFDVGGIPAWAPLSNATIERRERRGTGGSQILVETGALKEIATSMRPWSIHDNEAYMLAGQLGNSYYGVFHDSGTHTMPARPWSTIDGKSEENIEEVFGAHVTGNFMKVMVVGTLVGGAFSALGLAVLNKILGR